MIRWFFHEEEDEIVAVARLEAEDGTIGDASATLGPEEEIFGFTYEELKAAAPGAFDVDETSIGTIA